MTELIQKRIWDNRRFKLLEDGVHVCMKTPTEDAELTVKYEDLGLETVVVRKKAAGIFFIGLMVLSCFVGKILLNNTKIDNTLDVVFLAAFSIFFFGVLYLVWSDSRKQLLGINGGSRSLALLRNSPNTQAVDLFVAELHDRIKDNIIKKRLRPDDKGDFEYKKMMLDSLKDAGIVDESKYEILLSQINPKKSKIGFISTEE